MDLLQPRARNVPRSSSEARRAVKSGAMELGEDVCSAWSGIDLQELTVARHAIEGRIGSGEAEDALRAGVAHDVRRLRRDIHLDEDVEARCVGGHEEAGPDKG